MSRGDQVVVIKRADYTPLPWRVESVELCIDLYPEATRVSNTMQCVRHASGDLFLNGEDQRLLEVRINGEKTDDFRREAAGIWLSLPGDQAEVTVVSECAPRKNTSLSGLYMSNGGYFTQCEAEGFRRITYFPDRPDNMACYKVRLTSDASCPVLLSNGNLINSGSLPDGRLFADWEDPFPKPSYLFALVAADLDRIEKTVKTASGRDVLLQVWVEHGMRDRTEHAMVSLEKSLRWDEQSFGLELDLDRYMIVAVSDFNMGAMENKGLNIFNSKFVLAKPETATDIDYENIESVVAHEYFHNWTGNRITCRDWFQLTLKEGLTVFRDQQFSADMLAEAAGPEGAASARAVKRIDDVKVLRTAQFGEDAGPMAHPIRPDSYQEINNFYTATVYEKGSEVIRMLHTLLGHEGFRSGMDLYFSYHDGQAVTCDDFVDCMAEATGRDLDQFMLWYSQAGTPRVRAQGKWLAGDGMYALTLSQHHAPSPGQPDKEAMLIPVAVGLIGPDGKDLPLQLEGETHAGACTRVLELKTGEQTFRFVGLKDKPVPSLLRGFSAPVHLELDEDDDTLAFRCAHDHDAFNRWDAGQRFAERVVLGLVEQAVSPNDASVPEAFVAAWQATLTNPALDPAFLALACSLPSENYLLEQMPVAKPAELRAALIKLMQTLGAKLAPQWLEVYHQLKVEGPYRYHPADAGRRALRNLALRYLVLAGVPEGIRLAVEQFESASNMTDRFGAMAALVMADTAEGRTALDMFGAQFRDDALVMDKWFALQASVWRVGSASTSVLDRVMSLSQHEGFSMNNPNKVYALLGGFFRNNPAEFHRADGAGYVFWADRVIELDRANPQVASRMARSLENWRRYSAELQTLIKPQLERVAGSEGVSADVAEIVSKALAG